MVSPNPYAIIPVTIGGEHRCFILVDIRIGGKCQGQDDHFPGGHALQAHPEIHGDDVDGYIPGIDDLGPVQFFLQSKKIFFLLRSVLPRVWAIGLMENIGKVLK
jgi:hypothetical protein